MTPSQLGMAAAAANETRKAQVQAAQIALPDLLSGEATWLALKERIKDATRLAPQDHDVFIRVGDVRVLEARFIYPHSFSFEGLDNNGNHTWIVVHFSQLSARIVYLPKHGHSRRVTGFGPETV